MDLASCHMAKMTTVDFLEDGEWAGYYSTSHASGGYQHFHPLLHGLRIAATAQSDSASTLNLDGTGNQGTGPFDLDGTLVPETVQILLTKR